MRISEYIPDFQRYLETSTDLRPQSRTRYLYEVNQFALALGDPEFSDVTPARLLEWHSQFHDLGRSPRTVDQKKSALKKFFAFLEEFMEMPQGAELSRRLERLRSPEGYQGRETYALTANQFRNLLTAAGRTRGTGSRDAALVHFAWETGARRGEIIEVRMEDVDLEDRLARVTGKGNKTRVVFFTEDCRLTLEQWLEVRESWAPQSDYFFVNADGRQLSAIRLGGIIRESARRAGLPGEVWMHIMRHSAITNWLESGMPIQDAAALAGHASVNTTFGYTHQGDLHLREAFDRATRRKEDEEEEFP